MIIMPECYDTGKCYLIQYLYKIRTSLTLEHKNFHEIQYFLVFSYCVDPTKLKKIKECSVASTELSAFKISALLFVISFFNILFITNTLLRVENLLFAFVKNIFNRQN